MSFAGRVTFLLTRPQTRHKQKRARTKTWLETEWSSFVKWSMSRETIGNVAVLRSESRRQIWDFTFRGKTLSSPGTAYGEKTLTGRSPLSLRLVGTLTEPLMWPSMLKKNRTGYLYHPEQPCRLWIKHFGKFGLEWSAFFGRIKIGDEKITVLVQTAASMHSSFKLSSKRTTQ